MLFNLGFGHAWLHQGVTNRGHFIILCKQRLKDQFIHKWFTSLNTMSSCTLDKNLTLQFQCNSYFKIVTNCKHRIALTKFRTKNHKLPNVIQGRGRNRRNYNDRLCSKCNILGDEYHCIFECVDILHIRSILPEYYTTRPSMLKLISLLSSTTPSVIRKLSKFLYLCQF